MTTPKKPQIGRPALPEGKARKNVASQKYSDEELGSIDEAADATDKSRVDFIRDAAIDRARRINRKS